MSFVVRFRRPEKEIPLYIRNYQPEIHTAPVDLRDLQVIAERTNREHVVTRCWASNAGGLHLILAGRGMKCQHRIAVEPTDSYSGILARVNAAAVAHVDDCLGRRCNKPQQLALFA